MRILVFLAAVACIVVGFGQAMFGEVLLFPSLAWFLAAIAITVVFRGQE